MESLGTRLDVGELDGCPPNRNLGVNYIYVMGKQGPEQNPDHMTLTLTLVLMSNYVMVQGKIFFGVNCKLTFIKKGAMASNLTLPLRNLTSPNSHIQACIPRVCSTSREKKAWYLAVRVI